ncbi:MAG: hypothetical protein LBP95_11655 [Deltaproteobacteria bacterium]|nr:hypothetical protein [Deltaproteobacteria bacterium]
MLARRDLACNNLLGKHIIPVLEPVRFTSTLIATLNLFKEKELPLALILNPSV